jgi:hypothetical protein
MYKCPYCNSNSNKTVWDGFIYCESCDTLNAKFKISPDIAMQWLRLYRKEIPPYDENFEWRIFLLRLLLKGHGRVLEVLSQWSGLSVIFNAEGFEYETTDFDCNHTRANTYDAIILWDVLEYAPDPNKLIDRCSKLLNDRGVMLLRIRRLSIDNCTEATIKEKGPTNILSKRAIRALFNKYLNATPVFIEYDSPQGTFIIAAGRKQERVVNPRMSVLMVAHPDAYAVLEDAVGPRLRIFKTIFELRKKGVEADLSISMNPDASGYNLTHLFHHAWECRDNLQQALSIKYTGIPLVISPIYMDLRETDFALRAIPEIFSVTLETEKEAYLRALEMGEFSIGEFDQNGFVPEEKDNVETQRLLLSLADHIIGLSLSEIRQIGINLNIHKPFTIVPNCADPEIFLEPDHRVFYSKYGLKDFVISVGHIEVRKNTLMLIYAMREMNIPLVIVGNYFGAPEYYRLCKYYAGSNTIFIPQLRQEELASAYALARLHALPSWTEGASLATIEAAMAGCNVLVSNRAGEWEYYGEDGFYCNPTSYSSIQEGILRAYKEGGPERRKRLKGRIIQNCTFQKAAEKTMEAYQRTLMEDIHVRH